jgi:putative transcriptional regulator
MTDSLTGRLLIASPHLMDPNFARSVILLVHHGEQGTLGLILNRPTDSRIDDFWHNISELPCISSEVLHVGGPVAGPLTALHTMPNVGNVEVLPGLFFASQREILEKLVSQKKYAYRLFIGHSGWDEGQLPHEMDEGSWLMKPATSEDVFGDETEVWRRATEQVGRSILALAPGVGKFPPRPEVN